MSTAPSNKIETKTLIISLLIALTPITIIGSIFWRSSEESDPAAVASDKSQQGKGLTTSATTPPEEINKKEKPPVEQKSFDPPPVKVSGIVAKPKSVEKEKPATERRRHISVLPDRQPKEPEVSVTPTQALDSANQLPEMEVQQPKPVECYFKKFPFGVVERRTYLSREMCDQAQKMWSAGLRLLEPDGTINERHVVSKEPSRIPGMAN